MCRIRTVTQLKKRSCHLLRKMKEKKKARKVKVNKKKRNTTTTETSFPKRNLTRHPSSRKTRATAFPRIRTR